MAQGDIKQDSSVKREGFTVGDLASTLTRLFVLAYLSQTVSRIGERLVPQGALSARVRQNLGEWLSTAAGVGLGFAADADILAELGLPFQPSFVGVLLTGLIVGQGGRFLTNWIAGLPRAGGGGGTAASPRSGRGGT